jgi:sulfite oxidase
MTSFIPDFFFSLIFQFDHEANPYARDPVRHPALVVNSNAPFNAETPSELLADAVETPSELFYVRNHLPVPDLAAGKYVLRVDGYV